MTDTPPPLRHGVNLVDALGIQCLCESEFLFQSGGWLAFNKHLSAEFTVLQQRVAALEAGISEADELLAGMWSFNEQSRTSLRHTYPVQASDRLRALLTSEPAP